MSGGGTLDKEFGFVVVADADGALATTRVTGFEAGVWRSSVPAAAVAIFHTHRDAVRARPSDQDVREADRLQIPIFVISSRGLWAYEPDPNKKGKGLTHNVGSHPPS